ncbi:MAG: UDP-N-acetylmuramate dehydrogenase [Holosporales bacterium]|jgi:UDP-N-acetylmuramate dehydrogenase|nr:UDP-N-acetylmuramate dehydrogenase [Holosporales bacterium]
MLHDLPKVRGEYIFNYDFRVSSFLRVGGRCDVMFCPMDKNDLIGFLRNRPSTLDVAVIGNTSNTIILDGGVKGCVINLSRHMDRIKFELPIAIVDAGALLLDFINLSVMQSVSSCEKLYGIPGTVGGAIAMNAGIPEFEMSDVLVSAELVDYHGQETSVTTQELNMRYRSGNIPSNSIVTSATLRAHSAMEVDLSGIIKEFTMRRLRSQPVGATCGSTFKNPPNMKAWELIKASGCDQLFIGGAAVSDKHCNFLVNTGNAKASDFVELIEIIKNRVLEKTGVLLEEEIKIIGEY